MKIDGNEKNAMKMKLYSSLLNTKIRNEFEEVLLVFGLVFLSVSFQKYFSANSFFRL